MFPRKKLAARFLIILLFFLVGFLFLHKLNVFHHLYSVSNPIDSKLLICEGWLPEEYYSAVKDEFISGNYSMLLFTGGSIEESVGLYENGRIILKNLNFIPHGENILDLNLTGSFAWNEYSKARFLLSDSLLGEYEIGENQNMHFRVYPNSLDSLVIEFNNDAIEGENDRNLFLNSLSLNGSEIDLFSPDVFLQLFSYDTYYATNYKSTAERAYRMLNHSGIAEAKMAYVVARKKGISKTYNIALVAVDWMEANDYSSANIITASYHSKRTYKSFSKAGKDSDFGIVSISVPSNKYRLLKEITGCFLLSLSPGFILEL
jgi:hypothetical protein